ncbi:pentatricopeptide repeat domain-containing protein (PPR motif) [Bradyrhizobium erythrophlei]|nr:pentatricopeptide repeat domain-containing protein (PPR motif) [Bradyrhizobium erythrophlei]
MKQPVGQTFQIRRGLALLLVTFVAGCGSPEQTAQGYYDSGMALIEKKDDQGARRELLKALKYKSDKVEVWRALAGINERTGAGGQAVFQDLRRIIELDPNDLDARLKLGRIMVGGGAADAALKVVDAAKEEKPSAPLHALRSIILLRTNDNAGAVREAQRAFDIDPGNLDAVTLLASKRLSDGDADGALKLLDSLKVDPKDETRISLLKMQIYARKGDLAKSEDLLRKVISLNPSEPAYRSQLIQFLVGQRRFDEAEKELRARVEANRADSKVGLDLVRFLNSVRGPDATRKELEARIKAGGDVFDYQIALAELDFSQNKVGDAAQALQALANTAATAEKKTSAQLKLAEMYVSKANITAAEPVIADILSKDSRNAGALKLRAAINIDRGQLDSAISDVREALNDQPKSPDLLMLLAVAYERVGKNELADRQYADALKSSGLNPDVALRYVAFLQRTNDAARAEDVLVEVANRNPNNLQVLSSLGQIRLTRQKWPEALAVADAIGRIANGGVLAEQIRASAFAGQNKMDDSVAALERAHQAAPEAVQPLAALASAYVKQGKPDDAIAMLKDMTKRFPGNTQFLILLGQAQLAKNNEAEALQTFKEVVAQQPKNAASYKALADLYTRQKKFDAAENVLQAGLKELPADSTLRLAAASVQILKGDYDAAIAQYEAILKDQPNSVVAINNLVSLLLDFRSDKESLDRAFTLADALKNLNVPQFQDTVGWAQNKRGDIKGSVSTLEKAAEKLPSLAAVHYHLGMSYAAAGQPDKSAEELKKALALEPDGTALKESIRAAMK